MSLLLKSGATGLTASRSMAKPVVRSSPALMCSRKLLLCSASNKPAVAGTSAPFKSEDVAAVVTAPASHNSLMPAFAKTAMHLFVAGAVLFGAAGSAEAAGRSGGRVGGSSFGRSSVGTSASRSSVGGSSGAFRSLAPQRSTTTSHTTIVHTGGWGMPFGFGMPYYGFGGYGVGGGSMLTSLLLMAVVGLVVVQVAKSMDKGNRASGGMMHDDDSDEEAHVPVSVAKLQVGLLAVAKDLKAELAQLAHRADGSSAAGLHLIMQETVLALLRNPDYCVYGASTSSVLPDEKQAERIFGSMSMAERANFGAETLSNVGGFKRTSSMRNTNTHDVSELIVVTLLVAAEGQLELPTIRTQADLKMALSKLGSVSPNNVVAVEVMWTPEAEGDAFTTTDMMTTYPHLAPLL